jgi:hypothetical protein
MALLVEVPVLYVVSWNLQAELIREYCMGECGKIFVGELHFPRCGVMLGCEQFQCPVLEDEMDFGNWELPIDGLRNIIMRRLKART